MSGEPPEPAVTAGEAALGEWERAFDSIQDPIAIADADGVVRRANRAFRRRFAANAGDLGQVKIGALLYCDGGSAHDELGATYVTYETSGLRVPGTFLASHTPIDLGDGLGLVYHLTDVTALRAAEEALRRSEAAALQAQKMEAIGRLAGGVAHDFNNLLTAVLCSTEVLLERVPRRADLVEPLEQIQKAAERGAGLVNHLLSFSRPKPGRPEIIAIDQRIIDLTKFLGNLIGEHIRIILRLEAPETRVRIDPVQLEQVLLNLAVNARDAMAEKGTLTFATTMARGADGVSTVTLAVTDTGSGMDEATRAAAFEPFFTTKPEGRGTGLGLATVFAIVKQAGGEIELDSAPGRGTTVRIGLPAAGGAPLADDRVAHRATVTRREAAGTVLLVEDEEGPRRAVGRALDELGYEVLAAADAASALDLARRHPGHIDVLLADVVMPETSGPELARDFHRAYPSSRILLMSGYASDAWRDRSGVVAEGELPFLRKPFTVSDLARRLDQVLARPMPESR